MIATGVLSMPLFRPEVLNAKQAAMSSGRVVLKSPAMVTITVLVIGATTLVLVLLLLFGEYTKRTNVSGNVEPDHGQVKILPPQTGQILKRYIQENQHVNLGDVLFVLSSERTTNFGETGAAAVLALHERQASLARDLVNLTLQQALQRVASQRRIADLRAQLAQMGQEIDGQHHRVENAQVTYDRYVDLGKSNFVPAVEVQQHADDLLDQQGKLSSMERSSRELQSQIEALQAEIAAEPLKDVSQKDEIERDISSLQQNLAEAEAGREVRITAPISGTVVGIQVEPGQTANSSEPLASVIPDGSSMVAYFYAPSSAIGFVKPGQIVMLRYQPFPYQKFGQHQGVVTDVSHTAIKAIPASVISPNGEPLYRITVKPDEQSVLVYGRNETLQPDMQVDADILTDRRRLIEWIFEPLLSIKGRL